MITALAGLIAVLLVQRRWRRREEESLRRQREQFADTMRAATVSRLATSLAHELNQPLAGMVSSAGAALQFLEQENPDKAALREVLKNIEDGAHRAGGVMRSVRSMVCRSESARSETAINELVAGVRSAITAEARVRDCSVMEDLAPGLPGVEVDAVQIQQVLLNLVINAFDAMVGAGSASRRVEIRTAAAEPNGVCLSVRDFGPGLPAEGAEKLFEQFYTTKTGGMGMGLVIARAIAESHGGTLDAEDAAGGGARFLLRLPAMKRNQR